MFHKFRDYLNRGLKARADSPAEGNPPHSHNRNNASVRLTRRSFRDGHGAVLGDQESEVLSGYAPVWIVGRRF